MRIAYFRKLSLSWAAFAVFFPFVSAQQTERPGFPAPRYPDLKRNFSDEELLNIARRVVRKPSERDQLRPGYGIRKGEKVLIVVNSNFNRRVLDAISKAIAEAGARPDTMITSAAPVTRSPEGWQELAPALAEHREDGRDRLAFAQSWYTSEYEIPLKLATIGNYDLVIHGEAGPVPTTTFRWEYIPWNTLAKFVTGAPDFPIEVQELIDQKVWGALRQARKVRVTDPEGTDITWTMKPEYFELLKTEWPGYGSDVVMKGHVSLTPLFTAPGLDAKGVIAGTINHTGTFPHIKLFMEEGTIVRIEGGGRNGELWRQYLNKYKDMHVPTFPGPGGGWLIEVALATNPKVVRPPETQRGEPGMLWERLRSGIIHFGLGLTKPPDSQTRPEYAEFLRRNNMAGFHFHVHTLFNTVDVETADGKTIRIVDKGHITFLDDPEVRRAAALHGDPDQILREEWIPALPGINVEGDYSKDYAPAPDVWILKEMQRYYDAR
ncbi:MAG: hypothetical protein HY645_14600 [Acidobacteria bacterium]|nr:hypothetical protein [Acidobacteriota bacterium]